jgi:DNA-binding response OmpR family regulator
MSNVAIVNDKKGVLAKQLSGFGIKTNNYSGRCREIVTKLVDEIPSLIILVTGGHPIFSLALYNLITKTKEIEHVPVIIITRDGHEEALKKTAFAHGCLDVLPDDYDSIELSKKVRAYASLGSLEGNLRGLLSKMEGALCR